MHINFFILIITVSDNMLIFKFPIHFLLCHYYDIENYMCIVSEMVILTGDDKYAKRNFFSFL